MKTLSVIVPVYNEAPTLVSALRAVEESDIGLIQKELVVIDDCSTDGSQKIVKEYQTKNKSTMYVSRLHPTNRGKGAALRTGFAACSGDFILVQDADLEYDPRDYPRLLQPLVAGRADVVYGSRFISNEPTRVLYFHHYAANRLLTTLSNVFTSLNLSDMETGYKAFSRTALMTILPRLTAERFGIEVEITARVAQAKLRIYEVGIAYHGRTYEEGKKINWKDGVAAIGHIVKYNVFK
ncbi:MAG: glycosyltransferase family 2 protein [bacterium]|nr:glycosyltransferase family 2 protein [bacterium]MDZ4285040.1 glycosyltransferase family 2 protein [Patescibacteria group bacterium]